MAREPFLNGKGDTHSKGHPRRREKDRDVAGGRPIDCPGKTHRHLSSGGGIIR